MQKVKTIICGAGPAGLTYANLLMAKGEQDFLILEKEKEVGGLCRSEDVDGSPLDIGGGHILDTRRKNVNDFLFRFMPEEEWNIYDRDSKILFHGTYMDHPFESNIWQLPIKEQVEFIESIARAGCLQGKDKPEKFTDWIRWKLGDKITEEYMIPYNQKMFGDNLNLLGTYWLEKLPNVSFTETLQSCLEKKPYGTEPGHSRFYYPKKYGYGELWLRMGEAVKDYLCLEKGITDIQLPEKIITCQDGSSYQAERIIFTIPWTSITLTGCNSSVTESIASLKHTSVDIEYFPEEINTSAHWIYEPDPTLSYHRILVRPNFCEGSKGYWTETNATRVPLKEKTGTYHYLNSYAYPLNTIQKEETMQALLSCMKQYDIHGLGRWGEWQHYNSDVTVQRAMDLFNKLQA